MSGGGGGGGPSFSDDDLVWVPLPAHHSQDAATLLSAARANLRCLDGEHLTFDLMRDSKSPSSSPGIVAATARPLGPGETIDYFLSHSWHDDAPRKCAQLDRLQERYRAAHGGRHPTFWLDKVCIDQGNITDGLKVLVINVMACDKLLVACGKTYVHRLWCVLELFMLFAFGDEEAALRRIEFLPIEEEGLDAASICDALAEFKLEEARCYDPNEEARLREVMRAVGEDRFVARIRSLGRTLGEAVAGGFGGGSPIGSRGSRLFGGGQGGSLMSRGQSGSGGIGGGILIGSLMSRGQSRSAGQKISATHSSPAS